MKKGEEKYTVNISEPDVSTYRIRVANGTLDLFHELNQHNPFSEFYKIDKSFKPTF